MSYTLGTNATGFNYPGQSTYRAAVETQYNRQLQQYFHNSILLNPFIGAEKSGLPIVQKTDLKKNKGDTIRIFMKGYLSGLGKWGNDTLEESEEVLKFYYKDVYVNQWRNAVIDDGALSQQRGLFDIHKLSGDALGEWYAQKLDDSLLNTIYYGYPPHILGDAALKGYAANSSQLVPARYWYCADEKNNSITYSSTAATYVTNIKTAEAGLTDTSSDYFGVEVLEGVAAKLKTLNIPPVKFKGWTGYIGLIHPYQLAQLRMNEKWFNANITAGPRDLKGNPVFSGGIANDAVGMWNNIMLFSSNKIHSGDTSTYTDLISAAGGSATVEIDSNASDVRRAIFMGSDAVALAVAKDPGITRKGDFDYNNRQGEAVGGIWGAARCDYTSEDSNSTLVAQGTLILSTYSPAATC